VWRDLDISKEVKIRTFNPNVKPVLLHACETWKTTNQITRRLQMFVNKTDKITNKELCRSTHQKSIENQIKRRKWNWIGHTLCKETGKSVPLQAWTGPEGSYEVKVPRFHDNGTGWW